MSTPGSMAERRRLGALAGAAAAVAVLALPLLLPDRLPVDPAVFLRLPLELPAIILLLLAMPSRGMRAAVTAALAAMAVVKLADIGTRAAYLRPFNPVFDSDLVPAAWRLGSGAAGWQLALAGGLALGAALLLLTWAVWRATGRIAGLSPPRGRLVMAGLATAALALVTLDAARAPGFDPPGNAFTTRLAWQHLRDAGEAQANLAQFRGEAARDAYAGLSPDAILPALRGTDVFVIFVESYGRSALENPLYAPTVTAALEDGAARIAAAGLAARSGYLTAPMVGGQSWFAHSSVLAGVRIDNQGRYRALIASPRRTLLHLAQEAGWQTVAVMPAITLAWPEAAYFGYDRVLAAADLGYRGLPFNWVTMPDQFTLASFERHVLDPSPRTPVFAEIALISSHAPWTPIPPLVQWETLGDGQVFDRFASAGDPPEVLWRDPDRVREQYRRSLDYVLRVLGSFAARHAGRPPLMVILGDHQPAAFVSGDPVGRDVPVHIVGAPEVVARLDGWGWTPGLLPAADAPGWPMEAFRDRFLAAFVTGSPQVEAGVR